jgi:hypothetical protein
VAAIKNPKQNTNKYLIATIKVKRSEVTLRHAQSESHNAVVHVGGVRLYL